MIDAANIGRVLVVDDSAFARRVVTVCFKSAGLSAADFVEAGDGEEALGILRKSPFDLVITDFYMPKMNGDRLIVRMRANPRLFDTPVIVVSSAASGEMAERLEKVGADFVLQKPINGEKAQQAVLTAMQRKIA